jgi:hypothetical protein
MGFRLKLNKQTSWPESASEVYRPSDRRLAAKLAPTFTVRGVPRGQRDGSLRPYTNLKLFVVFLIPFTFQILYTGLVWFKIGTG